MPFAKRVLEAPSRRGGGRGTEITSKDHRVSYVNHDAINPRAAIRMRVVQVNIDIVVA